MTLSNLIDALSAALDFTSNGISEHHRRVAYLSVSIGRAMGLAPEKLRTLYFAASLHDIGAIAFGEKEVLARFEVNDSFPHCERGFAFLRDSELFAPIAPLLVAHHDRFDGDNRSGLAGEEIPLLARILHLADRIDVLADRRGYVLAQRAEILRRLEGEVGRLFDPQVFAAFREASAAESFWLDFSGQHLRVVLATLASHFEEPTTPASVVEVARIFSKVIDSKSRYTSRHSASVAAVAVELAAAAGIADGEAVATAGLLHDLGKLSIPEAILDKPGKLTESEFEVIKQHPYHTYYILERIPGFDEIQRWAAFHHERMDGRGYPFRIGKADLPLGSRVMAVADVFAALAEHRPYRPAMARETIERIMGDSARGGGLDGELVDVVLGRYPEFKRLTRLAGTGSVFVPPRRSASRLAPPGARASPFTRESALAL